MNQLKKTLLLLIAIAAVVSAVAKPAQAHVLESDGAVAAVLHIPPDDVPRAGQSTSINLAFASEDRDFDVAKYRIQASLKQGEDTVQTVVMKPDRGSSRDATANITFPKSGAYRLTVIGQPASGSQAFELQFSVRAIGTNSADAGFGSAGFDFWAIGVGSLAVLAVTAQYRIRAGGRYGRAS